jgi:hypothetical protein
VDGGTGFGPGAPPSEARQATFFYTPVSMPIRPYLNGLFVEPEIIQLMDIAFERVRNELGLSDHDPLNRIAARAVRIMARKGIHDPHELALTVLSAFRSAGHAGPRRAKEPP